MEESTLTYKKKKKPKRKIALKGTKVNLKAIFDSLESEKNYLIDFFSIKPILA